ncbi:hypothetical protein FGIG_02510 [Fasciola gigantica]|uniref:Uncharacterized protein n=1 Tax=Fasciola gigantica TaxID=46835 RepID=A0A504YJW1_FASGI|nr:hypothetical protein FGIG_02510 [Fasciola gigantica]
MNVDNLVHYVTSKTSKTIVTLAFNLHLNLYTYIKNRMNVGKPPNTAAKYHSICERSLWTRLTPGQNEALRFARGTHELTDILTEAGFTRETPLFVELVNHALCFATENSLTPAQLTVLIAILYELWELCANSPFAPIQIALIEANKLMLCHSVQRPPHSVEIFSIDLAKKCMQFIVERFFRYWKMYKYALAPNVSLIPQFEYDDIEQKPEKETKVKPSGKDLLISILKEAAQEQLASFSSSNGTDANITGAA